jgi:hypothetical protein
MEWEANVVMKNLAAFQTIYVYHVRKTFSNENLFTVNFQIKLSPKFIVSTLITSLQRKLSFDYEKSTENARWSLVNLEVKGAKSLAYRSCFFTICPMVHPSHTDNQLKRNAI